MISLFYTAVYINSCMNFNICFFTHFIWLNYYYYYFVKRRDIMQSNFLRCCFQRRSICRGKELIHAGSRSGSGTGAHITVHVNVKPTCRSLFIRSCTKKIVNQYLVSLGLSSMFPNCFSWWRTYRLLWLMNGLDSPLLDIIHLHVF